MKSIRLLPLALSLLGLSLPGCTLIAQDTTNRSPMVETLFDAPLPLGKAPLPVQVWRQELRPGEQLSLGGLGDFTSHPHAVPAATRAVQAPWHGEIRRHSRPPLFVIVSEAKPAPPGRTLELPVDSPERTGQASATASIQSAIDQARPGEAVILPAGTYRVGTLRMRDSVELHLTFTARLVASDEATDYPHIDAPVRYHRRALILFDGVRNAALTGPGVIDGRGSARRRIMAKPTDHPDIKLVHIQDSSDIALRDVHLRDSFSWTVHVLRSTHVKISGVSVLNEISPRNWNDGGDDWIWNNADGINPDSSSDVVIEHCFIRAGDDAVAVKNTDPSHPTQNITVRGTSLWSPTRGLKLGTETRGELMSRITFDDCDVLQAGEAMAIDLFDTATVRNVVFRAIRAHASPTGVHFAVQPRGPDQTALGELNGVRLEHLRLGPAVRPIRLTALDPRGKIRNITFADVRTDHGPVGGQAVLKQGYVDPVEFESDCADEPSS